VVGWEGDEVMEGEFLNSLDSLDSLPP
jgi:hypothetical protein